jgi:hypothetical protein
MYASLEFQIFSSNYHILLKCNLVSGATHGPMALKAANKRKINDM